MLQQAHAASFSQREVSPELYAKWLTRKAALDRVVERQCVDTDKASAMVSDANDRAIETTGNPKYPLELF